MKKYRFSLWDSLIWMVLIGFVGATVPRLIAQTIVGDTISNTLYVTNNIDMNGTAFTQGAVTIASTNDYRLKIFSDATAVYFEQRKPTTAGDWIWQYFNGSTTVTSAKLDAANVFSLYSSGVAKVSLNPTSKTLTLDTAIITATGNTLATNGAFTAGGNFNFTGTDGSLALTASGVALSAVGGNKNVTLNSSGTGDLIFNIAGAERARIKSSGNVGIGTSNPAQKLSVSVADSDPAVTTANSISAVGVSGKITAIGSNSTYGWLQSYNAPLYVNYAGNNTVLNGGSAGYVGIGTINPNSKLEIFRADAGPMLRLNTNFGGGNSVDLNPFITGVNNGGFELSLAGTRRLVIDTNGNVGIGTTTPSAKLEINGGGLAIKPASLAFGYLALSPGGSGYAGYIDWYKSGPTRIAYLGFQDLGGNQNNLGLNLENSANFIIGGGNVGIGTSSPSEKIEVNGNIRLGSNGQYYRTDVYSRLWTPGQSIGSVAYHGLYGPTLTYNANLDSGWKLISGGVASSLGIAEGRLIYSNSNSGNGGNPITWNDRLVIEQNGNVGIGTTVPSHKLAVNGTIRAKEIIVDNTNWADYVFEENYALAPLSEVESHIKEKKHLPGIPSAAEIAERGVSMGDMQSRLLSKVEELTLHLIAQEKRMGAQQDEIAALREQVAALKATSH